jgi:hypothetical protein
MSKMDGLRAMREARYEAARKGTAAATPRPKAAPAAKSKSEKVPVAPAAPGEELCGHKAISGRTCTREKGHSAKSHRYA